MNTLGKIIGIFAILPLLLGACISQAVQTRLEEHPAAQEPQYEGLLGMPLTGKDVTEFLISNNCANADYLYLCKDVGVAIWASSTEIVETVYLYLNNADGFAPYKGELPFGLKYYDIKEAVEYKLKKQGIGQNGMPDEGATPDHLHYWATYHQAGMTVIYNSPSAEDEDSNIYAILITE